MPLQSQADNGIRYKYKTIFERIIDGKVSLEVAYFPNPEFQEKLMACQTRSKLFEVQVGVNYSCFPYKNPESAADYRLPFLYSFTMYQVAEGDAVKEVSMWLPLVEFDALRAEFYQLTVKFGQDIGAFPNYRYRSFPEIMCASSNVVI